MEQGSDHGDSVPALINKLCFLHVKNLRRPRAFLVQPQQSHDQIQRRLRISSYDVVFKYLNMGPHRKRKTQIDEGCLSEFDRILKVTFDLRLQRRFDDANKLEGTVEKLWKSAENDGKDSNVRKILRFLLALACTGPTLPKPAIGHHEQILPVKFSDKNYSGVLPDGPVIYGDSAVHRPDNLYYTHYPGNLFCQMEECTLLPPADFLNFQIFDAEPGTGLSGGLFSFMDGLGDHYEQGNRSTLFGALVDSHVSSLNIQLDIPEITDENKMLAIRIPKINEISEDEGFMDHTPSVSSSRMSPITSEVEEDFWDIAMRYKPSNKKWEWRGRDTTLSERPYLTEAGPEAFDELHDMMQRNLLLLDPDLHIPASSVLTQTQLVRDIINLMIGVSSKTFLYEQKEQRFYIKPGVRMSGVSHDSLQLLCTGMMECASNYCRLDHFSKPPVIDSMYQAGLIFQAFTGGIRKFLQHYRGCILTVSHDKTIMQLNFLFLNLMKQIRFIAELCGCYLKGKGCPEGQDDKPFPTGLKLLSYLYGESLECCSADNYPVLLSLLCTSAGPYLMFVQDWVFHGVCRDVYGEFMIQVNSDYLRFRDKHFWTHGYTMVSKDGEESVPLFLADLADQIFVCGKSINLLRLCNSQHFLFNIDHEIPRVMITFSEEDLQLLEKRCQSYTSRMTYYAQQHSLTRQQIREKAEQAKQDLIASASRAAAQQMERLQAKVLEIKKAEDLKKRKQFQQLKDQMEKDLKRRESEREEEKAADKTRAAEMERQELLEAQANQELLAKAKKEMIERYEKMTAEAARREQKALWRVRRKQLMGQRRQFLLQEELRIQSEFEDYTAAKSDGSDRYKVEHTATDQLPPVDFGTEDSSGPEIKETKIGEGMDKLEASTANLLDLSSVFTSAPDSETAQTPVTNIMEMSLSSLPKWAEEALVKPNDRPVLVNDLETPDILSVSDLPKWAKDGLQKPCPVFGLDHTGSENLPGWAKKGLEKVDVELVTVDEVEIAKEVSLNEDRKLGRDQEEMVKCSKPHPSDATIGEVFSSGKEPKPDLSHINELRTTEISTNEENSDLDKGKEKVKESMPHPSDATVHNIITGGEDAKFDLSNQGPNVHSDKSVSKSQTASKDGDSNVEVHKESSPETSSKAEDISQGEVVTHSAVISKESDVINFTDSTSGPGSTAQLENALDGVAGSGETVHAKPSDIPDGAHIQASGDTGVSASVKTHIKMIGEAHISKQSVEEPASVCSIQTSHEHHPSKESEDQEDVTRPHVKMVSHQHATTETEHSEENMLHIKMSEQMHATKESELESNPRKTHLKMVPSMSASAETEQAEIRLGIRTSQDAHSSKESDSVVMRIKPRSAFGHVSDLSSGEYEMTTPKLKRQKDMYASVESDWKSYHMRPVRKARKGVSVDQETADAEFTYKPRIKFTSGMYSTKESEYIDLDAYRLEKFRQMNLHGHASDSSIQNLLYGSSFGHSQKKEMEEIIEELEIPVQKLTTDIQMEPYQKDFNILNAAPTVDLMSNITTDPFSGLGDYGISSEDDIAAYEYTSLPVLLKKSVTAPLLAQISLVNKSIVNYFLVDLKIEHHFKALRSFLFMEDGEFGQTLSDQLFEKLSTGCMPHEMLNPAFLNSALNRAFRSSLRGDSNLVEHFSFALHFIPHVFQQNAANVLDCLELRYKVDWPLNIVITENSMNKYGRVFSYLIQLKRIVWVLKDISFQLKRDSTIYSASKSAQFNQLQLYRHEMQHFVRVMQGYISNQIIEVTWQEFMTDLKSNVHTLDDLHDKHADYLNRAIFRCLLNKKAQAVMKIIQDIFCLILKFRAQLISAVWTKQPDMGKFSHPNFQNMKSSYKSFTDYSRFLFKVVNKLAVRGYQPHLQELLLRLNFNGYYKDD